MLGVFESTGEIIKGMSMDGDSSRPFVVALMGEACIIQEYYIILIVYH